MLQENTKLKILILTLLVLLVLIIWDAYQSNQPYERVTINSDNYIVNKTDQKYLDTALMVALNQATISGITVVIEELTPEVRDRFTQFGEVHLSAAVAGNGTQFMLFVDRFSHKGALIPISHEVIHIMQYHSGRLRTIPEYGVVWENDTISFDVLMNTGYRDRPWEMEAFNGENGLKERIEKVLY
jgi:hypothetical protein